MTKKKMDSKIIFSFLAVTFASSGLLADEMTQAKTTLGSAAAATSASTVYSIKKWKWAKAIEEKNTKVIIDFGNEPKVIDDSVVNRATSQIGDTDIMTVKYQLSEGESRAKTIESLEKRISEMTAKSAPADQITKLQDELAAVKSGKPIDPILEIARIDTSKASLREFLTLQNERGAKLVSLNSVPKKFSIEFSKFRGKVAAGVAATGVLVVSGIYVYSLFDVQSIDPGPRRNLGVQPWDYNRPRPSTK